MPETKIKSPILSGGISRQPAHLRLPSQVEDATNFLFSVADGATRRQGTRAYLSVSDLPAATDLRSHAIARDESEQYLMVYGNGVVRVFDLDGPEATVDITSGAADYLAEGNPGIDDLRVRTITDTTFIVNRLVATATTANGIDSSKMPVRMRRLSAKSVDGYGSLIQSAGPFTYYRFNELYASGPPFLPGHILRNEMQVASYNGVYKRWAGSSGTVVFGIAGYSNDPGNYATAFTNPTSTGQVGAYVDIDSLEGLASEMAAGFSFETVIKRTLTANSILFSLNSNTGNSGNAVVARTDFVNDHLWLYVHNADNTKQRDFRVVSAGISDGNWKHIVFSYDPIEDEAICVINGVEKTVQTVVSTGTAPTNFTDFTYRTIGTSKMTFMTSNFMPLSGYVDELAFYARPVGVAEAQSHYTTLVGVTTITPAAFRVEAIAWDDRASGNATTNPAPSLFLKQSTISDIAVHRERLVLAGDTDVVFSQAGDLFNFFLEDATNLVDSDPIDRSVGDERVTKIDFIMPFRRSLLIFTHAGRQYELSSPDVLTPATAAITATTAYSTKSLRPAQASESLYMLGIADQGLQLLEYAYDDDRAPATAANLSTHAADLLTEDFKTLAAIQNADAILVLPKASSYFYVHQSFWDGNQRVQSAWSKIAIDSESEILDIAVIDDDIYLLTRTGETHYIERLPRTGNWPQRVHLDRQCEVTGVYIEEDDRTQWTLPIMDQGVNSIVLGSDFGPDAYTELEPDEVTTDIEGNTLVYAEGDWSDGDAFIGRKFTSSMTLSRPFARDFQGIPHVDGRLHIMKVISVHRNAGEYQMIAAMPMRSNRSKTFAAAAKSVQQFGTLVAWMNGDASQMTLSVESNSPRPCTISAIEYIVDYESRMR